MTMNKILLVLIVSSGFLLIFYANNDIFTRKKWINLFQAGDDDSDGSVKQPTTAARRESLRNGAHHQHRNHMQHQQEHAQLRHQNVTTAELIRVRYVASRNASAEHNIFIIYTKENYMLKTKFELFVKSLLKYASVRLHLHIISDERSESGAEEILRAQVQVYKSVVWYTIYSVEECARLLSDITNVMRPHFSSSPGSYYSDALFFLSLGLHRIVDPHMRRAILIDCDVVFRSDVVRLFEEFEKFSADNLFGLAPELTPVYHHIIYKYRAKNPNTNFGKPYYPAAAVQQQQQSTNLRIKSKKHYKHGYPGLNSGVVLLDFDKIRRSKLYEANVQPDNVNRITKKYYFKGHLGDQDFYTLLGYEFPSMIYRLDCIWNRQLCTWWKENGYSKIFDTFFHCEGKVRLYHGNCNTRVPES